MRAGGCLTGHAATAVSGRSRAFPGSTSPRISGTATRGPGVDRGPGPGRRSRGPPPGARAGPGRCRDPGLPGPLRLVVDGGGGAGRRRGAPDLPPTPAGPTGRLTGCGSRARHLRCLARRGPGRPALGHRLRHRWSGPVRARQRTAVPRAAGPPSRHPARTTRPGRDHRRPARAHRGHRHGARGRSRLAIDNERLQADLRSQLADLRASRERIVERSDADGCDWSATCTTAPNRDC